MDLTGLVNKILSSAAKIDDGRHGLKTNGKEHEGRLSYERGIADALAAFLQALSTNDPQIILLAEEAFIEQEHQFCDEIDLYTLSSLTQALHDFERAFLCLEAANDVFGYKVADKTWPDNPKYRIHGCPKDAFHLTCLSHRTRLQNVLRTPGVNMIEKNVLQQRIKNLVAAQENYIKKQRKALNDK